MAKEQDWGASDAIATPDWGQNDSLAVQKDLPDGVKSQESPKSRTWGETAADGGRSFGAAANNAMKMLTDLAGVNNPVSEFLDENAKTWHGNYSPKYKSELKKQAGEKAALGDDPSYAARAWLMAKQVVRNPIEGLGELAGNVAPMVLGGLAGLGVKGITMLSAAMGAGAVKGSIADTVQNAPDIDLMPDPLYAEMRSSGMTEKEAKVALSEQRASYGDAYGKILLGAGIGAAVGRFGSVENAIANMGKKDAVQAPVGLFKGTATGAKKEVVTEIPQEMTETYLGNIGAAEQGANIAPDQGVVEAGVKAGILSAVGGGLAGAATHRGVQADDIITPPGDSAGPGGGTPVDTNQWTPEQEAEASRLESLTPEQYDTEMAQQSAINPDVGNPVTAPGLTPEQENKALSRISTDTETDLKTSKIWDRKAPPESQELSDAQSEPAKKPAKPAKAPETVLETLQQASAQQFEPERQRAERMRAMGETAAADLIEQQFNKQVSAATIPAELEVLASTPTISDLHGRPEFRQSYLDDRTAGITPAEAAARAAITTGFSDIASQIGISPKAQAEAIAAVRAKPMAEMSARLQKFIDLATANGSLPKHPRQGEISTWLDNYRDEAIKSVETSLYAAPRMPDVSTNLPIQPVPTTSLRPDGNISTASVGTGTGIGNGVGTDAARPAADVVVQPGELPGGVDAQAVAGEHVPGARLENGFYSGANPGEKYRVGFNNATGGTSLERRYAGGTEATFYVGKDGNLVDADMIDLNHPETLAVLWKTDNVDLRGEVFDALKELGKTDLSSPKRAALKEKLKSLVTGVAPISDQPAASTEAVSVSKPLAAKPASPDVGIPITDAPPAVNAPAAIESAAFTDALDEEHENGVSVGNSSVVRSKQSLEEDYGPLSDTQVDQLRSAKPDALTLAAPASKIAPSANTIFTEDAANAARARLKAKLGRLNSGLDPETMMDGITLSGYHIEKGARSFAAFASAMIGDLGDAVKPYLKSWYLGVRFDPRAAKFEGMDSASAVESADLDAAPTTDKPSLAANLFDAIQSGNMPKDNPALKKLVEAFDGKPADPARMKAAQEQLETAIVMTARAVVAKNEGDKTTFDVLERLYNSQPNLNIRTSTSIANQAYSTPAPLAFLASRLAGITGKSSVLEPTAGNGMLLIGANIGNTSTNEINDERIASLKSQGFSPSQNDATEGFANLAPQDAIVTNPPFGSVKGADGKPIKVKVDGYDIGQIDHLIAARALATMKDDGQAVLIIGANKVAGGLNTDDRIFFNWLYGHYNVVGHFEVDGDLYTRQGAAWPVRMIVINGRSKSNKFAPIAGTIQRVDNWSDVYEQYTKVLAAIGQPKKTTGVGTISAGDGKARPWNLPVTDGAKTPAADRPVVTTGSQGGDGDVAGAPAGIVLDSTKQVSEGVGSGAAVQRHAGQSDGARELAPAGQDDGRGLARNPTGATGTTALTSKAEDNKFQVKYVPRSSRKDEGVLTPTNMAQPTQDALSALEDAVGDIDEFVRKELGYATTDDLHAALMGLQVDSVAMAIHQIKKGKAVVIADQTGIGKGRQAAAIIRWAEKAGHIPVFVTKIPALFTDMYGDLADIGTNDINPFIMNSSEWIAGANGEELFANKPAFHKRRMEAIEATGQLPDGSNAVFMTYSQINKDNLQRRVLMSLAPNAVFILDESHNAAGASSTGEFVIGALELAKGVTYLSATYAKRPDNMPLYFKTDIGNAAADTDGLAQAMAAGGLPLQTVVSNNLVKAGQMFRRERSYDGVQINSVFDTGNRDLHEQQSNEATSALRALVSADTAFHSGYVKSLGQELAANGESVQDNAGNQASAGVQHTEFSSVVHNFIKQMLLGLKAQSAADEAIASLKRGEKPLIAVENTMGTFLNEYAADNNIVQGAELGAFDYRTVLSRALERSRVVTIKDAHGNETKRKVPLSDLDAKTREAYQSAQAVIDGLKLSIPVSPIDWMRSQIIKAGYSVAEITGRDLAVDYSNPAKPIMSAVDDLEQSDKVNTTRQFNSGKLDALILNVSGSTGISLHASEKFSDQRQRHMIVAQAAGDINIFMQMLGRIHRTGQVALPKYTILSVDLPTEKRPTAVLSIKMKSLNANTSSNTESATSVQTVDILNKYGDQIVSQYLSDNYALAVALDAQDLIGGEDVQDDIARKATGRLALQPIEVQHAFYDEVEGQYNALIEYLNKTNQNDLEPRTFDFDAKETRQEVLFEGPDKSTHFGEDAIYGEYSIKAQGIAMKPEEIREAMKTSLDGKDSAAHVNGLVNDLLTTWTAQVNANRAKHGLVPGAFDADKYGTFMAGLYGKDAAVEFVARATKQISSGQDIQDITAAAMESTQGTSEGMEFMREHAIGKTFRIDINSEPYNAVVTNIRSTHKTTGSPFSLSKVQLTVSVNGALRSLTIPGTQFKKIVVSAIQGGYRIDQLFKEQPPNQRETAKIVTGNLLAAYGEIEGARGTIISFTKQDGTTEQGILLPKLFDYSKNTRGDYRLPDGATALRFLQQSDNKDIGRFGIMSRDGNVRVLPSGQGIRVQVPKSKVKGGKFFLDKALIEAGGDFVSSGNYMVSTVYDRQPAEAMLDLLMKKQALYALPSMAEEAKAMGDGIAFSRSAMKSVDANVRRGMESLAKALDEKTTVHRAMFRNGLGWVDFVWGSEGALKASGKYRGAMGLSHIIEARQSKDGMSEAETIQLLGDIVESVASGKEVSRNEVEGNIRIGVEKNGVIVWLTKTKANNAWVVTGYAKNPDGAVAGRATTAPTSTTASLTRDGRVAGFREIVAQELKNGNPQLSRARRVITATTVPALQQAIKEFTGTLLKNQLGSIVAATSSEIKKTWVPIIGKKVNLESEGSAGKAQAFFDPTTKTIFLIADRIEAGTEQAVLAHELMHKHGQSVLGETGWNRLHGVISSWKQADVGSNERVVYDYARSKVEDIGVNLSTEELFPYAVEAAIKMGIKPNAIARQGTIARWLASVRQNLMTVWNKIVTKPETFKTQDLVDLAFAIAQKENFDVGSIENEPTALDSGSDQTDTPAFKAWYGNWQNDGGGISNERTGNDDRRGINTDSQGANVGVADVSDGHVELMAFDPTQVKSAIGNNGNFDGTNTDIRYSRILNNTAINSIVGELSDRLSHTGTLSYWHNSVGTMYNLSKRNPYFKRTFDAVQNFINNTSFYATEAANLAPTLLPQLQSWKDIFRTAIKPKDNKALAMPVFEGTLIWGRDESGKLMKMADLEAKAAGMTSKEKARVLLKSGIVTEAQLRRWLASPLDIYDGAVRNRYEANFLKEGVVFTDAELKAQFNLTPGQIKLYREFRAATDKSLTNLVISDMVKFGGKDVDDIRDAVLAETDASKAGDMLSQYLRSLAELDPDRQAVLFDTADKMILKSDRAVDMMKRGYAPLSRFGHYTLDVVDENNKRLYFGMFESKNESNKMAAKMRANYPDATQRQGTVSEEEYKLFAGVSPETLELFGEMLGLEATGTDVKSQVFQEYLKIAKSQRSAMKRMIQRKGISGFSEDATRVLAGFVYSNARQTSSNLHAGEITQSVADIPQGMGDVKDLAVKLMDYVQNPQEEAQAIRGLLFAQYIGGSVASAIVNLTQPFTMTLPWLSQYGGIKNATAQLVRATKDALKKSTGDVNLDRDLKLAEELGIVSPQEVHQLQQQAAGRGALESGDGTKLGDAKAMGNNSLSRVMLAWGKLFGVAEQFNRRSTFIAAYRIAIEQKMVDPIAFAKDAVDATQGIYCVDDQTECLTASGWKHHTQLAPGEMVYSVDDAGSLVESPLIDVHSFTGNIAATEFKNQNGFSMVLTDDHTCLVQNYNNKKKGYDRIMRVKAKDVKIGHHFLRVPYGDATGRTAIYSDDEVALFAWVAAEGHLFAHRGCIEKRGVGLVQSQSHNPHHVAEIDALLDRLRGHYNRKVSRADKMVCWQLRKPLWLKIHEALPGKLISFDLVNKLTIEQMALFLDVFVKGDGHIPEEGGPIISQKDIGNLDALQAMTVLSGKSSTIYHRMGKHDFGVLAIAKNSKRAYRKQMTTESVTLDMAWCPETTHGTWIARRNGRTFITGNSKGNKPQWARGAVGGVLFTFKQFTVNYVEMLHRMATSGKPGSEERKTGQKAALYALGILFLVSGVGGLPGADDLDDLISGLLQAMGYNFDSKAARREFLLNHMSSGMARFVEHGVSGFPGMPFDVSGRLGLGNLFPGTGLFTKKTDHTRDVVELLGPAGDLAKRAFDATGKVISGDVVDAVFTVAPTAVRNVKQSEEMYRLGMYRDQNKKMVVQTDTADAISKGLGFNPNSVKLMQDATGTAQRIKAINQLRESEIASKWAQGIFENDKDKTQEARDELAKWNRDNPDMRISIQYTQLMGRVKEMRMSKEERIMKTTPKEIRSTVRKELSDAHR